VVDCVNHTENGKKPGACFFTGIFGEATNAPER
jgi:hypothetical protein